MSSNTFTAGDVFWAPDPYRSGARPRPWLVLASDSIPYSGEEYVCAGLTLSDLPANVEVTDDDWVAGGDPERRSFCSPWVLATVKHDSVSGPQGYVTEEFTRKIVGMGVEYLSGDVSEEMGPSG